MINRSETQKMGYMKDLYSMYHQEYGYKSYLNYNKPRPALRIMRPRAMQNNEAFYHNIYILKNFSTHGLCYLFNFL